MQIISLGPLMLRADILLFIISAAAGYAALHIRLRGKEEGAWMLNVYLNALIIGFLIWKFSILVLDPVRTLENPMSLLFLTGGERGLMLGTAAALVYIGFKLNRHRHRTVLLMYHGVLAFLACTFTWHIGLWLLNGSMGVYETGYITLSAILFVWMWGQDKASMRVVVTAVLWYSIASVLIPFFDGGRYRVFSGFSSVQIAFGILSVLILCLDTLRARMDRRGRDSQENTQTGENQR